jgi:hypothetical protein
MSTTVVKIQMDRAKVPFLARQMAKWFMTLPLELVQAQPAEVH